MINQRYSKLNKSFPFTKSVWKKCTNQQIKYNIAQPESATFVPEKQHFTVHAASPRGLLICLPNIHLHIYRNAHHAGIKDLLKCSSEKAANGTKVGTAN